MFLKVDVFFKVDVFSKVGDFSKQEVQQPLRALSPKKKSFFGEFWSKNAVGNVCLTNELDKTWAI